MSVFPVIEGLGVLTVGLLFAGAFTDRKQFLIWGNIGLALCFGLIACTSLYFRSALLGIGFGLCAAAQTYRVLRTLAAERHGPTGMAGVNPP
jgi:hypothetical protein